MKKKKKRNKELKLFTAFFFSAFTPVCILPVLFVPSLCAALSWLQAAAHSLAQLGVVLKTRTFVIKIIQDSRIIMLKRSDRSCHCGRVVFGPIASRLEGSFSFMFHSAVVD